MLLKYNLSCTRERFLWICSDLPSRGDSAAPNATRMTATPTPFMRSIAAKKEAPRLRCFYLESGSDLSSRAVSSQVLSALKGLTAVFGMGTGGTPSSLPPEMVSYSLRRSLALPDCRIVAPFRFPVKPLRSLRLPVPLALSRTLTTAHRMIQSQTVFQLVSSLSFGCPK